MRVQQIIALLSGLVAIPSHIAAFAFPAPTASILVAAITGSQEESVIDHQEERSCCPTAYIRAPDLRPGLTTAADARLFMNGTACDQVEKWEVGLRLKEWAIFRFSAPNVTIPSRPEWSPEFDTPTKQEDLEDDDLSGLFNNVFGGRQTAFQKAMQDYERSMSNRSLWHFEAAERQVFDSRVELDLNQNENTIKNETTYIAVRQFVVDVPDTNFPPKTLYDNSYYGSSDFEDASHTETLFEYYFLLTLKNGTTIDLPAGRTAFIPANTEGAMLPLAEQVKRAADGEKTLTVKLEEVDTNMGPRYRMGGRRFGGPADDGIRIASDFTVELMIPANPTLEAGRNLTIQAKVHRIGNSTDIPHGISLTLSTCTIDTWATTHATTSNHTEVADRCAFQDDDPWWTHGGSNIRAGDMLRQSRDMKDLCIHPLEWSQDEEENAAARAGSMTYSTMYPWEELAEGMTLFGDNEVDGIVTVNLTIPPYIIPTFDTTFRQYKQLLNVAIATASCSNATADGASEGSKAVNREIDDLEEDFNWSPYPEGNPIWEMPVREAVDKPQKLTRHQGTAIVHVITKADEGDSGGINAGRASGRIKHYSDPKAAAMRLRIPSEAAKADFPLVNTEWKTDFKTSELTFNRYDTWRRVERSCSQGRGSAYNLVSEVWARKGCPEYRKNWFASRKAKKAKEVGRAESTADVVETALALVLEREQKVLG